MSGEALAATRRALEDERAWLVGGAVRDRLLGRATDDVDVALDGDPRSVARRIARATGGASFRLSGAFGAWRVVGPGHAWHVDLVTLRDGDILADLAHRDFTINAMAEPLHGGELVDPHGGRADLDQRLLRMVSERSLAEDPLRALRAVRLAVELDMALDPATGAAAAAAAPGIARVAPERVFGELKRVVCAPDVRRGLELMGAHGLTDVVLGELTPGDRKHALELVEAVAALQRDPAAAGLGEQSAAVARLLSEPLADELTRGGGMRLAGLLHGAGVVRARRALGRLRASRRLADYVAALVEHRGALGALVGEGPVSRRAAWRYLRATAPYAADVTAFAVAARLAARDGDGDGDGALASQVDAARRLVAAALEERARGVPGPLVRGDELVRELGATPGPQLGRVLSQLAEDRYAGEVTTREDALARARALLR